MPVVPLFSLDLTPEQLHTRDRYGFWLAKGGPDNQWYLYVPAGTHADGSPLTQVRRAWPQEIAYWQAGDYDAIAQGLVKEGMLTPVPQAETKRQRWARLKRLWQKVRGR